jgi:hypothetical protein
MKVVKFLLAFAAAMLAITNVYSQNVDEIIDKYIEALGGIDKINGIQSMYKESDIEIMGNSASSITYVINKKGYKMEMNFSGSKIIQCVTDKGGWGLNPLAGQTSPEALPGDQVKSSQSQLDMSGPLVDYTSKGNTVALSGMEDVNGKSAFKLNVVTKDSLNITIFIDSASYYVVKTVSHATVSGQDVETTTTYSNFQKTDYGYVVPFAQELVLAQGISMTISDKKVEINKTIDPAIFEMPK